MRLILIVSNFAPDLQSHARWEWVIIRIGI